MRGPSIPKSTLLCGLLILLNACANEPAALEPELEPSELQVSLSRSEALASLRETVVLDVVARDPSGADLTNAVLFTTSNEGVATVRSPGIVTATGNGEATITAQLGTLIARVGITVSQQVRSIEFDDEAQSPTLGQTATLGTVLMLDSLGSVATNDDGTKIAYEILDREGEFIQGGVVTTVAGIATVTDRLEGLPGTRSVRVQGEGLPEAVSLPIRAVMDGFLVGTLEGVQAVSRADGSTLGRLIVDSRIRDLAVSFDEETAIVTLGVVTDNVGLLDLAEGGPPTFHTILGRVTGVATHPSQPIAYVVANGAGVTAFDLATKTQSAVLPASEVGRDLADITVSPDGSRLLVVGNSRLSVVSTASLKVELQVFVGAGAHSVALSPDGSTAYVSIPSLLELAVITLADGNTVERVGLGRRGAGLQLVRGGEALVVSDPVADDLSLIDTQSNTLTLTRNTVEFPGDMTTSGSRDELYVLSREALVTLNPGTLEPTKSRIQLVSQATSLVLLGDGR